MYCRAFPFTVGSLVLASVNPAIGQQQGVPARRRHRGDADAERRNRVTITEHTTTTQPMMDYSQQGLEQVMDQMGQTF